MGIYARQDLKCARANINLLHRAIAHQTSGREKWKPPTCWSWKHLNFSFECEIKCCFITNEQRRKKSAKKKSVSDYVEGWKKADFFVLWEILFGTFVCAPTIRPYTYCLHEKKNRSEEFQWIAEKESSEHEKATLKVIRDERGRGWIECCAIFKISFFPSLFKSSTQLNIINILKRSSG